jgi:uncharacterized membrane protein YgcG
MEAVLVRSDGAIQVRAVIPYEKARAFFANLEKGEKAVMMGGCGGSANKAAQVLAARAAVGLTQDAADFAANKLADLISGFSFKTPFKAAYNAARKAHGFTTRFSPSHAAARYMANKLKRKKRGGAARAAEKEGPEGGEGGGGGGGEGGGDEGAEDEDQEQDAAANPPERTVQ